MLCVVTWATNCQARLGSRSADVVVFVSAIAFAFIANCIVIFPQCVVWVSALWCVLFCLLFACVLCVDLALIFMIRCGFF